MLDEVQTHLYDLKIYKNRKPAKVLLIYEYRHDAHIDVHLRVKDALDFYKAAEKRSYLEQAV